jgi:hypothetical protein
MEEAAEPPPPPAFHSKQTLSSHIPLDTFAFAFSFLDGRSLLVCAEVCSSWEEVRKCCLSKCTQSHALFALFSTIASYFSCTNEHYCFILSPTAAGAGQAHLEADLLSPMAQPACHGRNPSITRGY